MKTIDNYILKQTIRPLIVTMGLALLFLLIERMLRLLEFVLSSKGSLDVLLKLLSNLVPHYIGVALPAAFLIALLMNFGRLQRDSELDACLAAGFGMHQQIRSVVFLAIALTAFAFVVFGFLQPYTRYGYRSLIYELSSRPVNNYLREETFIELGNSTYMVESLDRDRRRFSSVFAFKEAPDKKTTTTVVARLAALEEQPGSETSLLHLYDGSQIEVTEPETDKSEGGEEAPLPRPQVVAFQQTTIPVKLARESSFRPRGNDERELTLIELWSERDFPPTGLSKLLLKAELHERLVRICTMLALPFFAVPLAMGRKRASRMPGFVFGMMIIIAYNKVLDSVSHLMVQYELPAILSLWSPFILICLLSAYLFYQSAFSVGRERLLNSRISDFWSHISSISQRGG